MFPEGDFILQEDGAPAHSAQKTKDWQKRHVPQLLKGWPATSPDLSPLDYGYWSILQERVLAMKPKTEVQLRAAIVRAAAGISREEVVSIIDSWPDRLAQCVMANGGHFEHKMRARG